ncbi:hypothetical protein AX17_002791 [Amanita inopinata Kibby_2008]|nr:hypothetical protein AX17_002791 [Amanita inopinata Kibby_2008]
MPRVILKPPAENPQDAQRIPVHVVSRSGHGGGEKDAHKPPVHRVAPTRYKEKFNSMRQKYEQVTARHDDYQRQLDIANAKIKKLQAENDLLLDVIATDPSNIGLHQPPPNLSRLSHEPNPPYTHQSLPQQPPPPPPALPTSHPSSSYPILPPLGRSHEGAALPPPSELIQGPNSSYSQHPAPPPLPPSGPPSHSNHHQHSHRSPRLVQLNGGGSGSSSSRNGYQPTMSTPHLRPMESHERETGGPLLPSPSHRSLPPIPPSEFSSHEMNGRHI